MMRYLSTDQKILYQQYAKLGEEVIKDSKLDESESTEMIWSAIAEEGIWRLPIDKRFGGQSLTWQDCIVALDGFFSQYSNTELLTVLIAQMSSLFLISQYGTVIIKHRYLPRLMQGEMANLHVSNHIHRSISPKISFSNKKSILSWRRNKIYIYAKKINKNIVFTIHEKQLNPIPIKSDKATRAILTRSSEFIARDVGLSALIDLINFEKLLYGILSASYLKKLKNQYSV